MMPLFFTSFCVNSCKFTMDSPEKLQYRKSPNTNLHIGVKTRVTSKQFSHIVVIVLLDAPIKLDCLTTTCGKPW